MCFVNKTFNGVKEEDKKIRKPSGTDKVNT